MPVQIPTPVPIVHLPVVAWTTIVNNVVMLTDDKYNVTVVPIDVNEPGAEHAVVEVGFFLKDFVGSFYKVTAIVSSTVIEVKDDFKTGYGPQSGQPGLVYQSVADGTSPYLAPVKLDKLDKSARDYSDAIQLSILWAGQKPFILGFETSSTPGVYSPDWDNIYADTYGQNPGLELITYDENGDEVMRMERPLIKRVDKVVDGVTKKVIDEIAWDLAESENGYIKISRT